MRSLLQIQKKKEKRKKMETDIFSKCVITFQPIKPQTHSAPLNDCLTLSFVKYIHLVGTKRLEMVGKRPTNQSHILINSL